MENRKRSVLLIYGEETENISIRVPKSKKSELRDKFYEVLKGYEDPKTVLVDCVVSEVKPDSVKSIKANFKKVKAQLDSLEVIAPEIKPEKIIDKTEYEYLDKLPFSRMIQIIGHKCHKHLTEEIYYVKPPDEKGLRVIVLHSEKEVKDFIRKEIVK